MQRKGNRKPDEIRRISIQRGFIKHAEGSALIDMGDTRIICTASILDGVPDFLKNTGKGWLTAEYSMLPRATPTRKVREASRGKIDGRTQEIQRIIGRALRSVVDLSVIGERTLWIDCDVIQADGGTRTASITGGFVALIEAVDYLMKYQLINQMPVKDIVAAVSVGIVDGEPLLDLNYEEDSRAEVDLNVVKTGSGRFVEIQGTAEQNPFEQEQLDILLEIAGKGISKIIEYQRSVLGDLARYF
jgi:ribonuclease PH